MGMVNEATTTRNTHAEGNMTARRFGVELEGVGITAEKAAETIREALGTEVRYLGYTHERTASWKVVSDSSLRWDEGAFEAVSAPMTDIDELRKVARALARAGAKVNRSCGMHTHVSINDLNLAAVKRLAKIWLRVEGAVETVLAASRRGENEWCHSNLATCTRRWGGVAEADRAIDRCDSVAGIGRTIGRDRYMKLNLESFASYGTVEFRAHQGTMNGEKAANWVRLCIAIVELAKRGTSLGATRWTLNDLLTRALPDGGTARAPRAGTIAAKLFELFERAEEDRGAVLTDGVATDLAVAMGFKRNTARGRYQEWRRAQRAAGATNNAEIRGWFAERAEELAA